MINLDRLAEYPIVAPDCETTGLQWMRGDKMFGIAIAAWDGDKIVSGYWDVREKPRIIEGLRRDLPNCQRIVNHNMKFDAHILRKEGIMVPLDRIECTMVRAALINEHEHTYNLNKLGLKHLGRGKEIETYDELAAMFGGKPDREAQMPNLQRAPESLVRKYATTDPELAILLWQWQEKEIEKQDLTKIWSLERALTPVIIEVEEQGIRVDPELARRQLTLIQQKVAQAQASLNELMGKEVNANSTPQMRAMFGVKKEVVDGRDRWFTDKGFQLELTDSGGPSLGKKILEVMARTGDKRAEAVLALRKFIKATQFLSGHVLGFEVNGRVYPNYNQTRGDNDLGTETGRFSMNEPAMQQIPSRDRDIHALVRPAFLPEEGHEWCCADWRQFEFRWFAHYTNDRNILQVYADDPESDYHAIVAGITGIPRDPPHAGAANAKQINLGLVFGMGQGEMAYQMGMDYTTRFDKGGREWKNAGPRAASIFATYHTAIPGVQKLQNEASSIARSRGYVRTAYGRHIRFPNGSYHKAAGLVLQGTSADCIKLKMIALHEMGKREGFKYLLPVHDENNTSLPVGASAALQEKIRTELEAFGASDPVPCRVPIRVSIKTGANWHLASKKG